MYIDLRAYLFILQMYTTAQWNKSSLTDNGTFFKKKFYILLYQHKKLTLRPGPQLHHETYHLQQGMTKSKNRFELKFIILKLVIQSKLYEKSLLNVYVRMQARMDEKMRNLRRIILKKTFLYRMLS